MNIREIATEIKEAKENIILIYAFNATGKTRLSVDYKEVARNTEKKQTGVYYNAFSEDLFYWDNDIENEEKDIKLFIEESSLNIFHEQLDGDVFKNKLEPYHPRYGFKFNYIDDADLEKGFDSISFYLKDDSDQNPIKISRGEERIFVWCFFLALFEVDDWTGVQNKYFFIDDPVSSLDDHNIFITAFSLFDLIEKHFDKRKVIITTHHLGLFNILSRKIKSAKKEKPKEYKYKEEVLERKDNNLSLKSSREAVLLYHLRLLQVLSAAIEEGTIETYHFVLLRQVLENVASFLGVGFFSYVLEQIELKDKNPKEVAEIINSLSHQNVYSSSAGIVKDSDKDTLKEVVRELKNKYEFVLHPKKKNDN